MTNCEAVRNLFGISPEVDDSKLADCLRLFIDSVNSEKNDEKLKSDVSIGLCGELSEWLKKEYVEKKTYIEFLPDGVHPLSPHEFVEEEVIQNAWVQILRCKKCGHISIGWRRN